MARMRSLKPEFWADEELAIQLSRDARLLYLGLWNLADEHGRLRGDPRYIKGQLLPYDDDLTADDVDGLLADLTAAGKVVRYSDGPGRYIYLPNLAKHQRLEAEKVPSRLPTPPETTPDQARPNESGSRANKSAPRADESEPGQARARASLKHVAGSREHVAGSREQPARGRAPDAQSRSPTQRSKIITDAYAAAEPMCKWPAVNAVVLKAIQAGKWADGEIHDALLRLAKEGRSVTIETLRIELSGLPPPNGRLSTTDQRVAEGQALKARLAARNHNDP